MTCGARFARGLGGRERTCTLPRGHFPGSLHDDASTVDLPALVVLSSMPSHPCGYSKPRAVQAGGVITGELVVFSDELGVMSPEEAMGYARSLIEAAHGATR